MLLLSITGKSQETNEKRPPQFFINGNAEIYMEEHKRSEIGGFHESNLTESIVNMNLKFGYIFKSNWIAGVRFGFNDYKNAYYLIKNVALHGSVPQYGLFGRYHKISTKKVSWFVESNLLFEDAYNLTGQTWIREVGESFFFAWLYTYHSTTFNLNFGIKYNITPTTQFEMQLFNFDYVWYYKDSDPEFKNTLRLRYCIIEPNLGLSFKF